MTGPDPVAPARRRSLRSLRFVPALLWAAGIWWLSSQSDPPGSGLALVPHADKLAHAGLFGTLALLLWAAHVRPWLAVALATGWGIVDEVHQAFVPGRTPELLDVVADATGAVVAVALAEAVRVRWFADRGRTPG